MVLSRLSLKARIALALAAVLALHAAFYSIPRFASTRPRLDEAAYADALSALKETVGAEAVENGNFIIPRVPLSVPYEGLVVVRGVGVNPVSPGEFALILGPRSGHAIYIMGSFASGRALPTSAVATLTRKRAERLWRTLAYISTSGPCHGTAIAGNLPVQSSTTIAALDATWSHTREVRPAGVAGRAGPAELARLDLAVSTDAVTGYLARLYGDPAFPLRRDGNLIRNLIERALPRSGGSPAHPLGLLLDIMGYLRNELCTEALLPYYRGIERRRQRSENPTAFVRLMKRMPIVERLFRSPYEVEPYYQAHAALLDRLSRVAPSQRPREALGLALGPADESLSDYGDARTLALHYAFLADPAGSRARLLAHVRPGGIDASDVSPGTARELLLHYRDFYGEDLSFAEEAARSMDPTTAGFGNYALYLATGDVKYLDELMKCVESGRGDGMVEQLWCVAYWSRGSWQREIVDALMRSYGRTTDAATAYGILARLTGLHDQSAREFVLGRLDDPATFEELFDPATATPQRESAGILSNLANRGARAQVTDVVMRILERFPDREDNRSVRVVSGLSLWCFAHCDERILGVLEPIMAKRGDPMALESAKEIFSLRAAPDPLQRLCQLVDGGPSPMKNDVSVVGEELASRFDEARLRGMLADKSLRAAWYAAYYGLYSRRMIDRLESWGGTRPGEVPLPAAESRGER